MANGPVTMVIPFETLVETISRLSLKDKARLSEILYEQIEQEEEDILEQDPEIRVQIDEALAAYEAGDYITLEEYNAQRSARSQEQE